MENQFTGLCVGPNGLEVKNKDYAFVSSERARLAYNEACGLIIQLCQQGTAAVKLIGNVLRVPEWLPYTP